MEPFHVIKKIIEPFVTDSYTAGLEFSVISLDDVALLVSVFPKISCLFDHRSIEQLKNSKFII